jgi:hypothetical protein
MPEKTEALEINSLEWDLGFQESYMRLEQIFNFSRPQVSFSFS